MIDAIFFDFGGVIVSSPFEAFAAYEQRSGLPRHFIRTVNSTNPDDNAWARFERGAIGLDDFVVSFEAEARELGHSVDGHEVLACLQGELRPEMVAAVRGCAERVPTALLTNNVVSMDGLVDPDVRALMASFEVVVESSVVGVRKPERRFYEMACELVGVAPGGVAFLDDLGVNLKPAREMGMHTIKVLDVRQAIRELEAITGFELGSAQW